MVYHFLRIDIYCATYDACDCGQVLPLSLHGIRFFQFKQFVGMVQLLLSLKLLFDEL